MIRIAIDVGGTFTDVVLLCDDGSVRVLKVDSTPAAPDRGFLDGFAKILSTLNGGGGEVGLVVHAGTIGTNLFIGQMGLEKPRVALVTTKGFRDVLEIGRQNRPSLYDLQFKRPEPLVERRLRFEVSERVNARGEVLESPREEELSKLAEELKSNSVESVAISFLNSYANPKNEELVKSFLERKLLVKVHASSNVDPEHREYERTSTTVINAILAPVISRYIESVLLGLREFGVDPSIFYVMSSSGGLVDAEEVKERPISAIESGPAAGVIGAALFSSILRERQLISLDMGGTTAKAGAIIEHEPLLVQEIEVGGAVHMGRYVKGSGYTVRYPSIDLAEVSAGGGTIIWVDSAGAIRVGPMSAGSSPGPACYGRGGSNPTVTDANLLLGRLGDYLLGGSLRLSRNLAYESMSKAARRAGLRLEEAAYLALRLVNLQMARAVKIVSLERGLDPRGFALMAFGGAGPMHAAELAEMLEIRRVIIPPYSEVFSALGLLLADMKYRYVSGMIRMLDSVKPSEIEEEYSKMEGDAIKKLRGRSIDTSRAMLSRSMDVRYQGQGYELEVQAPRPIDDQALEIVARRFEERHKLIYGFVHEGSRLEIVALRLTVVIPVEKPSIRPEVREGDSLRTTREAYFDGEFVETEVHDGSRLREGTRLEGPAIIEGYGTTVVIPPSWNASVDANGCVIMTR